MSEKFPQKPVHTEQHEGATEEPLVRGTPVRLKKEYLAVGERSPEYILAAVISPQDEDESPRAIVAPADAGEDFNAPFDYSAFHGVQAEGIYSTEEQYDATYGRYTEVPYDALERLPKN